MAPVVALKAAVVDPEATVTDPGTVRAEALLVRVTFAPPLGAACVNVMVQVLEEFCPMLAGLQASEETSAEATRLMAAVFDTPLSVAVIVAV